jgi:ferredoxin--NADP+ reductase
MLTKQERNQGLTDVREYDISQPRKARIKESTRMTPLQLDVEVRHILLELDGDGLDFVEGQTIGVLLPGPHEFGNDHHLRLYSIASSRRGETGSKSVISICVRRCFYIDDVSGERIPGIASNFLCDALVGDTILITGPYSQHFIIPEDDTSNIIMIGAGTGIAPFRAFVKHIYVVRRGWKGDLRLYYGARTGLEMLYMNIINNDLGQYYDERTFKAFRAISPRPHFDLPPALDGLLNEHAEELWALIDKPNTYVYLAGPVQAVNAFDKAMTAKAGSDAAWMEKRLNLLQRNRLFELIY